MIDLNKALIDPSSIFKSPDEILRAAELTKEQKIKILHRWEYDERMLEVAEEENMQGPPHRDILDGILKALLALGADITMAKLAPNKQHGDEEES